MSKADDLFIAMCKDIIENGYDTKGEKVRPKWEDGTSAYTIKRFGVVNRYNLAEEFPAITLRKTYIKSAIDELLWIWQKKSNNVHDLHSHIWDAWADEDGSIGKAYGYQLGVKHKYKEGMMDQVDRVIYDLKNNPYSRRIMTNIYVHQDLSEMNLYPCAYSVTFNVTGNKLNAILNQRSQDVLAANNWNVVQYAALVYMMAQVTGFEPGELVHVIADAHIYDRHIPIVEELISRPTYPAPKVTLNPDVKDISLPIEAKAATVDRGRINDASNACSASSRPASRRWSADVRFRRSIAAARQCRFSSRCCLYMSISFVVPRFDCVENGTWGMGGAQWKGDDFAILERHDASSGE